MKKVLSSLAVLAVGLTATLLSAAPASAQITDGADPQASGCSADAYNVASWPAYDYSGTYQANVELRYSPRCGTNWVRVTQQNAAYQMTARLRLDISTASPGQFARGVGNGYAYWWTGMLKAPGSTCVLVDVAGTTSVTQTLNWPTRRVC